MEQLVEKLGINLGLLGSQIFNFALIAVLLYVLLYKPILRMLEERKERIRKGMEDAEEAARRRADAEQEYERIVDEARREGQRIIAQANETSQRVAAEIKASAEAEAAEIRRRAQQDIARLREQMAKELRTEVGDLAVEIARRLIGSTLDENIQHRLVEKFLTETEDIAAFEELTQLEPAPSIAYVTSAIELSKEDREHILSFLRKHFGEDLECEFRVDPSLLGGLQARVGDTVVDGSLAAQLERLHERLR